MKQKPLRERIDFANIRELVEWAAQTYGDRYAYSFRSNPHCQEVTKISFRQFRDDVRALASAMLAMGCAGKHCALIGKLSYDWILTYFASLSIGAVLVPLDKDWSGEELTEAVKKADATFLFCDEELLEKANLIAEGTTLAEPTVYLCGKQQEHSVLALIGTGRVKFNRDSTPYEQAPIDADALALLVFTSGTTGKGKGVMLSQHAILSDMCDLYPYIDFSNKTVGVLPPHHTYGSTVVLVGHVMIGCEVYVSAGIRYVPKELKEQKPGHLILVPLYLETFYRKIWATIREQGKEALVLRMIKASNTMRKAGIDVRQKMFASVRTAFGGEIKTIVSGGAPINPEIVDFFDSIGIDTLNGYGITECAPLIAVNLNGQAVPHSVGKVLDMDTVKIENPNRDGDGEILVKGPNVMLGYYKDEQATAKAIDGEGFFHTGDYGKLNEDNILFITGRKKNLIILSNGKNVYPEEIENELMAMPGIQDVVVYEGKSKRGLEHNAIVAEIYPDKAYCEKSGIADMDKHFKICIEKYNKTAVPYKKIKIVKIRNEDFPKNTLRKIMRFQMDTTID